MIKLLGLQIPYANRVDTSKVTKWAIVDGQPHHHSRFAKVKFDIIIDHHPLGPSSKSHFVDIKENYGAASTIMTEYLRAAKIRPSPKLATALFYGIKTDTDNFVRASLPNDINAFRYLYAFTNMNLIKKIESSEITQDTLASFRIAMKHLTFLRHIAFIHMGEVDSPDILVIIADFFLKMAEATWCVVSGIWDQKLIIILRNAGFRLDAGKMAQKLFGQLGSAGGHKDAARAEIPLEAIREAIKGRSDVGEFVLKSIEKF